MNPRFKTANCLALLTLVVSGCAQFQTGATNPVGESANTKHEMYFGMARIAERNGKTESARKAYQRILDQDPNHIESLHRMAVTSVKQERLDEAIEFFKQGVAAGEPRAEFLGDYGYALYLAERFDESERVLRQSRNLDPDNHRVTNNLAMVLGTRGSYNESYQLFQSAGNEAQALANLAFVQSQKGDVAFAKRNYHSALEADPTLEVAANGLMEVYRAFPSDKSMIIKPFEGSQRGMTQMAGRGDSSRDNSQIEFDDVIRSLSNEHHSLPNSMLEGSNGGSASVMQASYLEPVEHRAQHDDKSPYNEKTKYEQPNFSGRRLIRKIDSFKHDQRDQRRARDSRHRNQTKDSQSIDRPKLEEIQDTSNSESFVLQPGDQPEIETEPAHKPVQSPDASPKSPATKSLRRENSVPTGGWGSIFESNL